MASSLESNNDIQTASRLLLQSKTLSEEKKSVEHIKKKRKHSHDLHYSKHELTEKESQNGDRWTTNNGSRSPSPTKYTNGLKTKLKKIKVECKFCFNSRKKNTLTIILSLVPTSTQLVLSLRFCHMNV